MFKEKTLLITGGTGSFGNTVLKGFLNTEIKEIRIFSRDEKKQDDMRKQYNNPKLKFIIGDVRDYNSIHDALRGVDYVFHAAALKQVPSCEFYPMQAVQTNVMGTENVLNAAIANGVKKVICLSTDKAAYPINAMGMTKAVMEKVAIAKGRNLGEHETTICVTRYGNVMASRGSVIPLFLDQIRENKPMTLTDPNMTRFMMNLDEAVDLVLFAFEHGKNGDLFIQKSPAATVQVLAEAVRELVGHPEHEMKVIGTRHGEKLYEVLMTKEERVRSEDMGNYFRIAADDRDLNYSKFFEDGQEVITEADEYNSHNTGRLNVEEMKAMLINLPEIQDDLKKFGVK
ncbi:MAG: polysaccharide biosynthesis protein [Cetobacterium sp.]|uniref:polysaccharide biosynthesis protein n=1 Tax=Cetobacterium sp. TaxID=2071632 RepID=UPI003EE605F2